MSKDQLKSLTEDELTMLWGIINLVKPKVIKDVDMEPVLFTSIKHKMLLNRIRNCKSLVKEQHHQLFDGLLNKLMVG